MTRQSKATTRTCSWPAARRAGEFVFVGGQTPHDRKSGKLILQTQDLPPDVALKVRSPLLFTEIVAGKFRAQTRQVFENLKATLEEAGSSIEHIAHLRIFLLDIADEGTVLALAQEFFGANLPSGEVIEARNAGSHSDILIHVDCIAVAVEAGKPEHVLIKGLEKLSQPFPTVTKAGCLLFSSQVPGADPESGAVLIQVPELSARGRTLLGSIAERASLKHLPFFVQQAAMWDHLLTMLERSGIDARSTLYHMNWMRRPMKVFSDGSVTRNILERTGEYLLTCFPTSGLRNPGAELEGRIIAVLPGHEKDVRVPIHGVSNSYFGMIKVGPYLFAAGEVPIDTVNWKLISHAHDLDAPFNMLGFGKPYDVPAIQVQTRYIYQLYEKTLASYGAEMAHAVHQTAYMSDVSDGPALEAIISAEFNGAAPPTTIVPILGASPFSETRLELEMIAYLGD